MMPSFLEPLPAIALLRRYPTGLLVDAARAAYEGGLRISEVTLDSEDALAQLETVRRALPDAVVGVGTVRSVDQRARRSPVTRRSWPAPTSAK